MMMGMFAGKSRLNGVLVVMHGLCWSLPFNKNMSFQFSDKLSVLFFCLVVTYQLSLFQKGGFNGVGNPNEGMRNGDMNHVMHG